MLFLTCPPITESDQCFTNKVNIFMKTTECRVLDLSLGSKSHISKFQNISNGYQNQE